jgi:uncharacterized protein involved in exopolysaccharide biosynthesis
VLERKGLTDNTTEYFDAQLKEVQGRLEEKERLISDYERRYAGQLPTQEGAISAALQSVRNETRQMSDSINVSHETKARLRSDLNYYESPAAVVDPVTVGGNAPGQPVGVHAELAAARRDLENAERLGFGPEYPPLKALRARVADLTERANKVALETPVSSDAPIAATPAEQARLKKIADIKAELDRLDKSVAAAEAGLKENEKREADLLARLAAMPVRDAELLTITRDYGSLQGQYASLLGKRNESALAASLERREMGEQFTLVDPARVPQSPVSPNRPVLTLLSLLAGLALGGGLVALLEYRDSSFRTDEELTRLLALPVLAVVPFMQSDAEARRRLRTRIVVSLGLGATVAGCLAIVAYTLVR